MAEKNQKKIEELRYEPIEESKVVQIMRHLDTLESILIDALCAVRLLKNESQVKQVSHNDW